MARSVTSWLGPLLAVVLSACGDPDPDGTGDTSDGGSDDSTAVDGSSSGGLAGPMVVSISEIKQDAVASGARIQLEGVLMSSPEGTIDTARSYFVQDPSATTLAGLRVVVPPIFDVPSGTTRIDVGGPVVFGERRGWTLSVETTVEGDAAAPPEPTSTTLDAIAPDGADRVALADMLVRFDDPDGQTLWVSSIISGGFELSEQITVDLAPFGVFIEAPMMDQPIQSITGLVLLDDDQTTVLPRSPEDIVF